MADSNLTINLSATGFEEALARLDPKRRQTALVAWYRYSETYLKRVMRNASPSRIRGKVRSKKDTLSPPRWLRVFNAAPLAHLIEGGTGPIGDPRFNHAARHFPAVDGKSGVMNAMDLPRSQAYVVARSIFLRGGNPPRPFVAPAWESAKPHVEQTLRTLMQEVAKD